MALVPLVQTFGAEAGTVSSPLRYVSYAAAAGEVNQVTVSASPESGGTVIVTDVTAAVTAGGIRVRLPGFVSRAVRSVHQRGRRR
jgi:hypothetical protein